MRTTARSSIARAAALACGLSAVASPSRASVIQYTYTGTVGYGYDRAGIFGSAESLTGESFTLVERFDTAHHAYRYVDDGRSFQFGGSTRGVARSASLTVTIGGTSRSIADLENYIYSGSVDGKHLDFVKDETGYEYAGFYLASPLLPSDYGATLTLNARQATFIGSYQFFSTAVPGLATYASFDVHDLTVGALSAVPLPGSLPLLGTSLLALAAATRLRRHLRKAP